MRFFGLFRSTRLVFRDSRRLISNRERDAGASLLASNSHYNIELPRPFLASWRATYEANLDAMWRGVRGGNGALDG
jgi:hypothetical protein